MTKVAFIGLGRMGHGMAGRYLDAGFTRRGVESQQGEGGRPDRARRAMGDVAGGCRRSMPTPS